MKSSPQHLELHVFVCTNKKVAGECCADKGSLKLRDDLKARMAQLPIELRQKVRINAAGCLGKCEEGIAIAIYPEGQWLTNVQATDIDEIEALLKDNVADVLKQQTDPSFTE